MNDNGHGIKKELKDSINGLLRAYATIVFLEKPFAGLIILGASMFFPNLGMAGLIAAITGLIVARLLNFPYIASGMHIYNSLLVGLSLGAFYRLDMHLLLLVVLGAIIAILLTVALSSALWRYDSLPVLSLPFVIVAMTMAFAARSYQSLEYVAPSYTVDGSFISTSVDSFSSTLGAIYFLTHPAMGLVIFLLLLLHSRYLALLAVCGFAVGYSLLTSLTGNVYPNLAAWSGFNFALTAMAIGGVFTIPGVASFITAMVAAAIAALLTTALQNLLLGYGLPVMAFPFLLTSLTVMAALRQRVGSGAPQMAPVPGLPETNYERARLARVRGSGPGSMALLAPFYGEWDIYQGFAGKHTHIGQWQYALDFYMLEDDKSYAGDGDRLEDFYCFGAPLLSPVYGTVIRIEDSLRDNRPGDMDTRNNWGNFILIRLDMGAYVLLAHLKQHSIKVKEKDRLEPGDPIAECGNSGRSPQPHLHLQVQQDAMLGSATLPFQLASVVIESKGQAASYQVVAVPEVGDRVQPAQQDSALASQLHLPVGRCLEYACRRDQDEAEFERKFHVDVTLQGDYRLVSDSGAAAMFQETNGVLAFYDRSGPRDVILDAWLLANGLTPLTDRARHWSDRPSARLLPLNPWQKLLYALRYPMGGGLDSRYQRQWLEQDKLWRQSASHRLNLFGKTVTAGSESEFDPQQGCSRFSLQFGQHSYHARLTGIGLMEDQGIPGWQAAFKGDSQ